MKRILFVCTHNTSRSVMAEAILRKLSSTKGLALEITSAGTSVATGYGAAEPVIDLLNARGVYATAHQTQSLSVSLIDSVDIICVMTPEHESQILTLAPNAKQKIHFLSTFDPTTNAKPSAPIPECSPHDPPSLQTQYQQIYNSTRGLLNHLLTT